MGIGGGSEGEGGSGGGKGGGGEGEGGGGERWPTAGVASPSSKPTARRGMITMRPASGKEQRQPLRASTIVHP